MENKTLVFFIKLILYSIYIFILMCLHGMYKEIIAVNDNIRKTEVENSQKKIFFIETSFEKDYLDLRELCSIESAAKHNPNATVYVKSVHAQIKQTNLLNLYPNIRLEFINATEILVKTPLKDWWLQGRIAQDPYFKISHLSNALRYALIYENGGLYSDLDTITLRSFDPFFHYNGFFYQSQYDIGSSFFVLKKAHPFLFSLMQDYNRTYNASAPWGINGPGMLNRFLQTYCKASTWQLLFNTTNKQSKEKQKRCQLVTFPSKAAYPIHYDLIRKAFTVDESRDLKPLIINSFSVHFNTKITAKFEVDWNSTCLYSTLAREHCPIVAEIGSKNIKQIVQK